MKASVVARKTFSHDYTANILCVVFFLNSLHTVYDSQARHIEKQL